MIGTSLLAISGWASFASTIAAVLIGAVIAIAGDLLLALRRERGDAKAAGRVLQAELSVAASRIREAATVDQRWYEFNDVELPSWSEYQAVLARRLSDDEWSRISSAATALRALDDGFTKAFASGGPLAGKGFKELSAQQVERMDDLWTTTTDAYNAVAGLTGARVATGRLHEGEPTSNELMAQRAEPKPGRWGPA